MILGDNPASQTKAVFIQWIQVKMKKRMVGMARFELATS
jgi:desulfoferrodoxin (superoxide reductase-like protein)